MGTLNSCLKSKGVERYTSQLYTVASATMQGLRIEQEDAHLVSLAMLKHPKMAFFGVFDGHGGDKASSYLKENILDALDKNVNLNSKNITDTLLDLDKKFISDENSYRDQGSTCIFTLVEKKEEDGKTIFSVICSNTGDSRCILIRQNGEFEPLSYDHKPNDKAESKRIRAAGGNIYSNRVDGSLAVSRAFGDYNLKSDEKLSQREQKVIVEPEIKENTCYPGDLLLICCDGIFEGLDCKAVVNYINENFYTHKDPGRMLSMLFELSALSGSSDNMTGVLVYFADGTATPSGFQFIPGPIFRSKDDRDFITAYSRDAVKNGSGLTDLVMLTAYHQDLMSLLNVDKNSFDNSKNKILTLIKEIDPLKLKINELAFLVNSLNSSIVMSPEEIAKLETSGFKTTGALQEQVEKNKISQLGLTEETVKNITILFALWRTLPSLEMAVSKGDASK